MKNSIDISRIFTLSMILLFTLSALSYTQVSDFEWAEMIGGSLLDESFSIATDDQGNCYVTGIFTGSADIGDTTLIARGATDIFLVKYNHAGEIIWIRQAGGKEDDDSYAVHIGQDGYCYLTGSFADTAYFEQDSLICVDENIFYFDIFLAKYTLNGELIWVTRAGEAFWDEAFSIYTNSAGDVFITGSYWGTCKFDNITLSGLFGSGATDGFDIFVAKYDQDGNALWANRMVERGWDRGSDITVDHAGNCYVTGGFQTALLLGGFGGPSFTPTGGSGDEDVFLVKYNSEGDYVWKSSGGSIGFDQARAVSLDDDNHIYLTGVFSDTAIFDSTDQIISHGLSDAFLAKYDSTGTLLWVRGAGSSGEDGSNDVIVDSQGNAYICGYFGGAAMFDQLEVIGAGMFIAKYDPNGNVLWVKQINEMDNLAKSLGLMPTGDLVVTGVFENSATFGSNVLSAKGQTDVFVAQLDTVAVSTIDDMYSESLPQRSYLAQNYPNPFNPITKISYQLPVTSFVELHVYNLLGQQVVTLVSEKQSAGRYEVTFNAENFSSGVYFYSLRTDNWQDMKKMILIK
jgi:hypothetical protein